MRNRILEIVVYLMDHIQEHRGQIIDIEDLSAHLRSMGYTENEISSAYSWLVDRFEATSENFFTDFPPVHCSTRILTDYERYQYSPEAYGFLLKLQSQNLIDDQQFETVLERGAMFSPKPITEEQIKLIVSSVVFNDMHEFEGIPQYDLNPDHTHIIN
ncbi:MAG: DUF494 family protein [candidate division Zixibacteria bacterium]|nr:DUF494 family protein [candidate division Zixibacteria bacterium]